MAAPPEAPSARECAGGDRRALRGHDLRQIAQWQSGDKRARVGDAQMSRGALALASALVLATALDVVVAAGAGYTLRMEPLRLVAVDAALLALLVAPILGALYATRWIPRLPDFAALVPRASVLFAAWAPILALGAGRVASASELAPHLIVTAILALVLFLEIRRERVASRPAEALLALS